VLIEGPSGSGKSALALHLIAEGATLVADDRTLVFASADAVFARAPRAISGLIERRGLGLVRLAARPLVRLRLLVDLTPAAPAARLPLPRTWRRLGPALDQLDAPRAQEDLVGLARSIALILRRGARRALAVGALPGPGG